MPPPAIMPSSTAAFVAANASSIRSFISFISVSVAAPTLITATPPASFARRSWSFSRSKSDVVASSSLFITFTRSLIAALSPAPSTMIVSSFEILTCFAWPSIVTSASLRSRPTSSEITWPPVRIAISWSIALRLSPNPGALTGTQVNVPLNLLRISVESASPSTSSAMITIFLPAWTTCSRRGRISWIFEIFLSVIKMYGSSRTASILSVSVTIYGVI